MLQELISQVPEMVSVLPKMFQPMAVMLVKQKLSTVSPDVIDRLDSDLEDLLDAIANKDYSVIGALFEKYHVQKGGLVWQIVARTSGFGLYEQGITSDETT